MIDFENHPDYKWIKSKVGINGASYSIPCYRPNDKACSFNHIYGKKIIYILYLNIILYFKWLKRRIKRWFKLNILIRRKL